MNPVTVVFPIAGQAPHAGFKYKPFLEIGDETAIEAAVRPFRPHLASGNVKKLKKHPHKISHRPQVTP